MRIRKRRPAPPPTWKPRGDAKRSLIESSDGAEQWALERILSRAGYEVAACDGPESLPGARCPLAEGGDCALAAGADVVVNALRLATEANGDVLTALRARYPNLPVVVEVPALQIEKRRDILTGCQVVTAPVLSSEIRDAVHDALST